MFTFAFLYFITANEMQYLYRRISEATIRRYNLYFATYCVTFVLLLALSIVYHVLPFIMWLSILSLSLPNFAFCIIMLYGLHQIYQASKHHKCLVNEKYMWVHVVLIALYALSELFRAYSNKLMTIPPTSQNFDALFMCYYTSQLVV